MDDSYYNIPRVAVVGTKNVAQTIAFIAEHERSTNINYFVVDDTPQIDILRGLDVVFVLTALIDEATCKTARLIADCVKNENIFLSVAIVPSVGKDFSDELNYLEQNFKVVINLEEQQFNLPAENFSYKIIHGIHSVLDEEFYPYLMPVDGDDLLELLTYGRKTFVGFGEASGENPTVAAVNAAIDSPLIKNRLQSARSVFLNILGYDALLMLEANEATTLVYNLTNPDGEFYWVVNRDDALGEKIFAIIFVRV